MSAMDDNTNHSNGSSHLSPPTVMAYFQAVNHLIPRLPYSELDRIVAVILEGFDSGRTVFVFGNGGSAASASHMMCDMNKGAIDSAISGSGNSPNVLAALKAAKDAGAITVGLAGYQGGKMKPLCDVCAVVPSDNMQMIEDMHHSMLHSLFTVVKDRIHSGVREGIAASATALEK